PPPPVPPPFPYTTLFRSRRWIDLYVECCEATHVRAEQPIEVLDLRMGALKEALANLRALCAELQRATADTVENAVHAANALGTLDRKSTRLNSSHLVISY